MPLTDTALRSAKSSGKTQRLFDGGGLYLEVSPSGNKWWRLKYRFGGKEKRLAVGVYGDVSLRAARERRDEARKLLANGIDPGEARKAQKAAGVERGANSFEAVAREWHAKHAPNWAESHADKILGRLEANIFPNIGGKPVAEITAPELLRVVRKVEHRGALETAHRLVQSCGQVFRYAIATGRAERNPAADLRGALPPWEPQHYPTITEPKRVGELLRAIEGYGGGPVVKSALRLAPLVFVRPGELRAAAWSEFDLDAAEWRIPAVRMKSRVQHIVPLSEQAVAILRELKELTGGGPLLFPGVRTRSKPMSENTLNAALRSLGYGKEQFTAHSFRSIASTLLNEQGWHRDAIERQLAHGERNAVRAAYNYAEFLPERRKMMQAWADYLASLIEVKRRVVGAPFGKAA